MTTYACPCCGSRTLHDPERGSFEICPICLWEDDEIALEQPDTVCGPNPVSLNQARQNYKRMKASSAGAAKYVRPPTRDELPGGGA